MTSKYSLADASTPARWLRSPDAWLALADGIWGYRSAPDRLALELARTLLDQPRWIEPKFLYDERGSHLFERICELPEYYLTRTEEAILAERAQVLVDRASVSWLVELGSGCSRKTQHLLSAQSSRGRAGFVAVDVSASALRAARDLVRRSHPGIDFCGLCSPYFEALESLRFEEPKMVIFLGSSIGNFRQREFQQFFHSLSEALSPGDYFLLGLDRIKDPRLLERAYNDSQGLTAEFILNAFRHIERLTGARFDHRTLEYRAVFNSSRQQMEMYVRTRTEQRLSFEHPRISWRWRPEEPVLVEISRKLDPARLKEQLRCFGLEPVEYFSDSQQWFSLMLFRRLDEPAREAVLR